MECFITWQLEPENSGLLGRKPIINSLLNKTKELKKKNEVWKQSRARTPCICVEEHAYACYNKPKPRLSNSITLRRGTSHLILSTHMCRTPRICVENQQPTFLVTFTQVSNVSLTSSSLIHPRIGVEEPRICVEGTLAASNHAEPTPESFKRDSKLRKSRLRLTYGRAQT
ncbi:hypothetical protein PIB30_060280 [Stylosanthes scabra]|uniref:Uncharacterized protein n=1 Tax=Stylosanthes scabra TaxID=79078 RepID=A0ABU6UML1_9FABA|nr:hypothetical protein [Stylosanthes scabra]